ncbi:phosphoribosylglycinamide formyltransferase [Iodidimonas gelatinilytica]|uniref:Phosphoribosylglycinamide formyltransferase n=1 Tax=Iodidimonas gelatinilytica TaxID=1236966 RepID=A0A5A7MLD2_9PROT|nr:phosphoribosylglycinamide formyltransferase [Iodidimonas gelatinilytica]GEQ96760.1 phosphoribosylglycinamide formyltransferase [Iodidimonas gelatinilytica]GER01482.1 phosphoribosylglycinamide formyltransferase [Iodidimonas gelatinilytica]
MARMNLGVLISGRGSNLRALIDACADENFPARIAVVISNRKDASGLSYAREAGIDTLVIEHTDFDSRADFDNALHVGLTDYGVELVCLAGFMRLLDPEFVSRWHNRMINIHPSLLPSYRGLKTHERALEDGVRFTGCTVHYVRPEMDSGPIIIQAVVPVLADDTAATLGQRVLGYEHQIYVEAVRLIASKQIRPSGARVTGKDLDLPQQGLISPIPVSGLLPDDSSGS